MSYDAVSEAAESKYPDRLPIGIHKVVVRSASKFPTQKRGEAAQVELMILESTSAKPGDTFGHPFFFNDPGYLGKYDGKQMRSLGVAAAKVVGLDTEDQTKVETPIGPRKQGNLNVSTTLAKIFDKKGWATGFVFTAVTTAVPEKEGAAPRERPLLNTYYEFVPQTKEDIAAMRKKLVEADEPSMLDGI
jgi:hypothetical protein